MSWQSFFSLGASNEYEVIEYFAGVGRIARMAAGNGYRAAAFDVVYDDPKYYEGWPKSEKQKKITMLTLNQGKSAMDLTTDAGFSFLGLHILAYPFRRWCHLFTGCCLLFEPPNPK